MLEAKDLKIIVLFFLYLCVSVPQNLTSGLIFEKCVPLKDIYFRIACYPLKRGSKIKRIWKWKKLYAY